MDLKRLDQDGLRDNLRTEIVEGFPIEEDLRVEDEMVPSDELMKEEAELQQEPESEIPAEQLGETTTIDDPVRMYLHEIGRVHLLTAGDEKKLAKKLETGKRVAKIKQDYFRENGRQPHASDIVLAVLRNISHSINVIRLIETSLGMEPVQGFLDAISNPRLSTDINVEFNPELMQQVAARDGISLASVKEYLITLCVGISLLPRDKGYHR